MERSEAILTTTIIVDTAPAEAFALVLTELTDALARVGMTADFSAGGKVSEGQVEVGTVRMWKPGEMVRVEWRPTPWKTQDAVEIRLRFEPVRTGTRVSWELRGWDKVLSDGGAELAGWMASTVFTGSFRAVTPSVFGDWLTDRRARRPSGKQARQTYRNPEYHWPNFLLILDQIDLKPSDRLLEVGCGGGAFLSKALQSGCTAIAIDHSPEMVRLAGQVNREVVDAGRLRIIESDAEHLLVPDNEFTWAVMTGVVGFLPDPVAALREMYRALKPGGRIAVFGSSSALRGTPAAPEPMASRIHFYVVSEAAELARRAGFSEVRVEEAAMEPYARQAGLPEDVVAFFRDVGGSWLLLARKAGGQ